MYGLDDLISGLGAHGGLLAALGVALLLGLRHASDPDHLVAVSTLMAADPDRPVRRASALGLSWGLGHATSLLALGLPIVLWNHQTPAAVQSAAELLIGVLIMLLAARLIRRWRLGGFHVHGHSHHGVHHRHLHPHARSSAHEHEHTLARSPAQAYCIGLVHGIGGTAAVGILLLASIDDRMRAATALAVFALGTAVSMSLLSLAFGYALGRERTRRRFQTLAPLLGTLSFAFGTWYVLTALQTEF